LPYSLISQKITIKGENQEQNDQEGDED
jgi:hypothetical protein